MRNDLRIKDILIEDELDKDREVSIRIESGNDFYIEYINAEQAMEIIEHLVQVFELDVSGL